MFLKAQKVGMNHTYPAPNFALGSHSALKLFETRIQIRIKL